MRTQTMHEKLAKHDKKNLCRMVSLYNKIPSKLTAGFVNH